MSRRGLAILLLSSIGFLVAVVLFFSGMYKINTVGNSTFLGESESHVLGTYVNAEKVMIFLENAARISAKGDQFADDFNGYIDKNRIFGTDIKFEEYEFDVKEGSVRGIYKSLVTIEGSGIKYSFYPNFIVYF